MSPHEIVCREFVEVATEYLEGAMPEETLELVEEHLAMCDWCRDYLAQLEATSAAVAGAPGDEPAAETLQTLIGAFRARAQEEPPT